MAIGRAITRDPKVFLFDEPLSNLDAALRAATRIEIARLKEKMPGTTMVYVSHDQIEAMTLADRIVVLNAGRIEQVGTPLELYHHPANAFVAGFIGSPAMNFIAARVESEGAGGTSIRADTGDAFKVNVQLPAREVSGPIIVGVRPEDLVVRTAGDALVRGHVTIVENLGELALAYVDLGAGEALIVKVPGDSTLAKGDAVALNARADRVHLFDRDGRAYQRPSSSLAM